MDTSYFFALIIPLVLWTGVLTYFTVRIYRLFRSLRSSVELDLEKKGFAEVKKRIELLEKGAVSHTQKVSLVRFNPFKELGGDHSFCLAILDGQNSGVLITSLHTRDRTRVYMKEIKLGKSLIELSNEEEKALKGAIK